jgi:hypothetical protein
MHLDFEATLFKKQEIKGKRNLTQLAMRTVYRGRRLNTA